MTLEFQEVFYDDVKRKVCDILEKSTTPSEHKEKCDALLDDNSDLYQELADILANEYSYNMIIDNLHYAIVDAINDIHNIEECEITIYDGMYGITEEELAEYGREVVTWCESQMLFELPNWKRHCELINDEEGLDMYGSSAYVVESGWYKQFFTK